MDCSNPSLYLIVRKERKTQVKNIPFRFGGMPIRAPPFIPPRIKLIISTPGARFELAFSRRENQLSRLAHYLVLPPWHARIVAAVVFLALLSPFFHKMPFTMLASILVRRKWLKLGWWTSCPFSFSAK